MLMLVNKGLWRPSSFPCTHLVSLTNLWNHNDILRPYVGQYEGPVGSLLLLMRDNDTPHLAKVGCQFLLDDASDAIDWADFSKA